LRPAIRFRKAGAAQALILTGIQMVKDPELAAPAGQAAEVGLLLHCQR
jgi:hypothetical protein